MKIGNVMLSCASGLLGLAIASGAQAATCSDLKSFALPGTALKITKAEELPAGPPPPSPMGPPLKITLPARCYVEGTINERTGAGGRTYAIGFAVALPDNWNGRFLFQGGGGLDGFLQPPLGGVAAGEDPALVRGYAVASTDSGHKAQGGFFDASFFADQQAALDFQYASIGTVTKVAKNLIADYYTKPAAYSYFTGCSMGGREGMVAAQRYPLEFDGVVSGAPAMHVGFSGIGDRWASATLAALAPKGADGKPDVTKEFTDADRKLVIDKLLEACDGLDGVKDGMIFAVAQCKFDPATLVCKGKKTDRCLTAKQAVAIKRAFAGPKDSRGNQVYPGFYYDTGIANGGFIQGFLNQSPNPMGPPITADKVDVDAEAAHAAADPVNAVGDTANWTNMSSFFGHGGKILFFHGVSDPWFSAEDTVAYYERMASANGGMETVRAKSSRLFVVPGMSHCAGGPAALDQFDLLTALSNWVENGKAPDSVIATGKAFPGRTRPLCAYPQHAHYKGQGDSEDAANFECKP
jgi:pimeloyl-ACP methyl ester carboxylesterase